MESLIFLAILVVFSLLRGGGKQKRQAPPGQRPQRPTLETEPKRSPGPAPTSRPARRTIFSDDTVYMFPKQRKAPEPVPLQREEIFEPIREEPVMPADEVQKSPCYVQEGSGHGLFKEKNELVRGIILAEILGPPLSKRKNRGFI